MRRQTDRLEELREEIKKGIESGEPSPADVMAIKARGTPASCQAEKSLPKKGDHIRE